MDSIEKMVARQLLDIEAVRLNPENPFTWASGWKSPIYCDNRKVLSVPAFRTFICEQLCAVITKHYPKVEVIAGVATGAIAMGALIADKLEKPFIYVRPRPKDHGTGAQIEGTFDEHAKVVVVEDLISTGQSSLLSVACLRNAGANVLGMSAIFSYNFDIARRAFEKANCELYTLTNYNTLIEEAVKRDYISAEHLQALQLWRLKPTEWGQ